MLFDNCIIDYDNWRVSIEFIKADKLQTYQIPYFIIFKTFASQPNSPFHPIPPTQPNFPF
jgi:hypothetical protein